MSLGNLNLHWYVWLYFDTFSVPSLICLHFINVICSSFLGNLIVVICRKRVKCKTLKTFLFVLHPKVVACLFWLVLDIPYGLDYTLSHPS